MSLVSQGILADVKATRRALADRFLAADAVSPSRTLALPLEALTSDEASLLEDFIARGTVVELHGEYYLDQERWTRENQTSSARVIVGVVLLLGVVARMLWYVSRGQ